jgi:hypothetical protein
MNAIWGSVRRPLLFLSCLLILNASCALGQTTARVVEPVDNAMRITLTGNVHPLVRAQFDRGAVAASQPMKRILLLLQRSDAQEAALQSYLEQQQDKSSPNYHVWLTPSEFGALYGPADADIQAVTQWLGSRGFTIEKVYTGKTVIEFSGTAGQLQTAFGASIHNYEVNGKTYVANANDPQIPAALAPVIAGIVSLNDFPRQSHVRIAGTARKIAGQPGLQPLFTFPIPNQSSDFYAVGPADFATIYNSAGLIAAGNDGTGQTVAIVGETNINVADVQVFRQMFGLPANFDSTNIILNGEDPGITSTDEETEADLDTQWSGAVAPGATIKYVVSASSAASQGIDLSALYIIEYNLAGVMSESYGNCERALGAAGNAFYNSLWEQAAAQGITAILSSGDGGSAGCDDFNTATVATQGLAVSGLASTPYNVALGGTDFDEVNKWTTYWSLINNSTTGASALSYIPEIPWSENCAQIGLTGCGASAPQGSLNIVAGSGGPSSTYSKPAWQMGVAGMPNDNRRDLPDVSLFTSPGFDGSGYIVCAGNGAISGPSECNLASQGAAFAIVGGTSASAPAFAGIMALVNQKQSTAQNTAPRQGNANYVLYALAKKSGASCTSIAKEAAGCIFNDVTHGNSALPTGVGTNSVPCQGGSPNCSVAVSSENGVLVQTTSATIEAWTVTAGYDTVTGLGSVNINNLATNWGTVNTVATTTALALSPTTGITHGIAENVTVNVTVTPKIGIATGDVSLIATLQGPNGATTQGLNQFTLNSNGQVVNATTNSLPGGTNYQVYAHYAGDGTNAPSDSAPVTVSVGTETSQTFVVIPTFDASGNQTNGNATSAPYASNYVIRMYVADKNAVGSTTGPPSPACYLENLLTCPSGTVSLTANGNPVDGGIFTLNNGGYTRDVAPSLLGGTYSLAAQYAGDNSYQGSSSATTFTVVPAPTQAQFQYTPSSVLQGQQFQIQALISVNLPTVSMVLPTGSVTFYDGNTLLPGTVSLAAGGGEVTAFLLTSFSTPGPHSITAKYSGDSNYAPCVSNPFTISSLYPVTIAQNESSNTIAYGQTITVGAIVSSTSKGPAMTGQVQFFFGSSPIAGVTTTSGTDANGNQILTSTGSTTPQSSGIIYVTYSGDANYGPAQTPGDLITVNIPDFSFGPTVSVDPPVGQAGSAQITITPLNQVPSMVTLSLSVGPSYMSGYTIAITPQQVSLNGSAATVTLSLTPNGSTPANVRRAEVRHAGLLPIRRRNWWAMSLVTAVSTLLLLGLPGRRRRFRSSLGLGVVSLLLLALGCGGGGGSAGNGGGNSGPPQPTSIALTTTNAKVSGNTPFTITAAITSSRPLSGAVSFYDFGQLLAGPIPVTDGQAQIGLAQMDVPGLYQVTASYSGDSENQPSTSGTLTQVITGTIVTNVQGTDGPNSHLLLVTLGLQ